MTNKDAIELLTYMKGAYGKRPQQALNKAIRALQNERQKGKWIKWNFKTFGAFGDWEYKCSNCEKVYGGEYKFCPECGADMRKENEND